MRDEVEASREAEAPNGDGPQLLGVQFSFDGYPLEECDPEAAFHGILVMAELGYLQELCLEIL